MNVTEFAERIVYGTTLEEKLAAPQSLTFGSSAEVNVANLSSPGRSADIAMHHGQGVSQPPKDSELANEEARGRLLHFLANHELLATELMALVLLKFPDAPHAFKRGVLVTLQEEQEHTRMYMKRMHECGVAFGSFPLSGHFWRVVEPMRSPMDFVSRLSLTFEQANLDYSLHFAKLFKQLGDNETAQILGQIYQDEIGHVQHGLQWFRQWKAPEQSDWAAYQDALEFPMSPQRGRGPICSFNRDGRKLAGLTEEFIDAMEVFRQSRGRPPTVRWFDAGAEAELSGAVSAKEASLLSQLSVDLEGAMIGLAKQDDVQLVSEVPSVSFRKEWLRAGLDLPEFVPISEAASLRERRLEALSPWAWTLKAHGVAEPFREASQSQVPGWESEFADLFRKSWAADRLTAWLEDDDSPAWLDTGPRRFVANATPQIEAAAKELGEQGYDRAILKSDLATSGRGQRRLACGGLTPADHDWLNAIWKSTDRVLVEAELDRQLDLSFLWNLNSHGEMSFHEWTRGLVTPGRRYHGTKLSRPFDDCDTEMKRFLLADDCGRLRETRDWLQSKLVPALKKVGFAYYFGVDAFVYRSNNGELKINPFVELNPRLTMGHVAMALRKHVAPTSPAEFRVFSRPEWDRVAALPSETSLQLSDDGRWLAGVVMLTCVTPRTKLIPAVVVGAELLRQCDN